MSARLARQLSADRRMREEAEWIVPTRSALQAQVCLIAGFESSSSRLLRRTDNSVLYRIDDSAAGKPYLLKACNRKAVARVQFDSLVKAHRAMGAGRLSVPEPAFILPELGAYCIEFVQGGSVRRAFGRQLTTSADQLELMGRCGTWIARYHGAFHVGMRGLDIGNRIESLEDDARSILELAPRDKGIRSIRRWMLENVEAATACKVSWGRLHGDFKPDNLLMSNDGLLGIDIETRTDSVQLMDVVQFVNNITLMSLTNPKLRLTNRGQRLTESLVEGYFRANESDGRFALRWLRVLHLVHTMNTSLMHGGFLSMRRYSFLREHALRLIA